MNQMICEFCKKNFKNDRELRCHIDVHTPYWKGKEIVVSGADQIRLMLKDGDKINWVMSGSHCKRYAYVLPIIKKRHKRQNLRGDKQ